MVSEDTALLYCTKRSVVSRGIDNVKKQRGDATSDGSNLRMKTLQEGKKAGAPPIPTTLKLK